MTAVATERADVIVVFGAAVWTDGPSMTLRLRVALAARLYDQGLAPAILCSGGWSNGKSEAQVMRAMLVAHGIPADAVIPDDGGVTTRDAIRSVRRFDGGRWRRVIAVSSPYHLLRIKREATRQGVDVNVIGAVRPGPASWSLRLYDARQHARELVARPAYALSWHGQRLLQWGPLGLAAKAVRHVAARLRFLVSEADQISVASSAISARIKGYTTQLSDTVTALTPAAGLQRPVEGEPGSRFGLRHGRLHAGLDLRAPYGAHVGAAAAGTVLLVDWIGPYGNVVAIDHGGGLATVYAHLAGVMVDAGATVTDGERIGFVGETGRSFGPHLHFEVRVHGSPVDPLAYLTLGPPEQR